MFTNRILWSTLVFICCISSILLCSDAHAYDCLVYECRKDYVSPIPDDRWDDNDYICANGGAACHDYSVPGAPDECPPVRVCFVGKNGFWKTTWHCTSSEPPIYACKSPRAFIHLDIGDSTGDLTESILVETIGGPGARKGVICFEEPPQAYNCEIPDWFMNEIQDKVDDWEQNGYVETNHYSFECTAEGCEKYDFSPF